VSLEWIRHISDLIKLGPVGIAFAVAVTIIVVVAAILVAGKMGYWHFGIHVENLTKVIAQLRQDLEDERKARKDEREQWREDRAELEERHEKELYWWKTVTFMTGERLNRAQVTTERIADAVVKSATSSPPQLPPPPQ
jgi:hypothetical protein